MLLSFYGGGCLLHLVLDGGFMLLVAVSVCCLRCYLSPAVVDGVCCVSLMVLLLWVIVSVRCRCLLCVS